MMRSYSMVWILVAALAGCTASPGARSDDDGASQEGGNTGGDDGDAVFGEERAFDLRFNESIPPPLALEMNRDEVAELFGDRASEVLLLELDSTTLLTNTLDEIKFACGSAWALDNSNPQHNCDLTPLGQSFVGPDGTWRTSPEFALVRVLSMTPANVDVTGTSSAALADLADALGVGGGYGGILADALGIPRTSPVVSTEALVRAFQQYFMASHPNVGEGAKLKFYLSDALSDLATLTERLGPHDGHPGVVDPSFPVNGEVFGPDFTMKAAAQSNLRLVDGLDADAGKGFLSVVVDTVGPNFDDEIEFDFSDPSTFALQGVVDDLTVDMRFRVFEHDAFVWSCLGNPPCQANLPGAPVNADTVWAREPFSFEYNVAAAAYEAYKNRTFNGSYLLGAASVTLGQNGNPPGWTEYSIPFGIGSPPENQYVWETILEVAQVALHHPPGQDFPEGGADVGFTLYDLPVGLSGAMAAEAVRPYLQAQASNLSDFLLGDYKKNNDHVDLFFRRGEDGLAYLFFATEAELRDGEVYSYARPGFFDSPSLSDSSKVSSLTVPGSTDVSHEKLGLQPGETVVYFEDDAGVTWRARAELSGDNQLRLAVAPRID